MDDELTCEVCNAPGTHTFHGVWTGSTAGPLVYCREHITDLLTSVMDDGDLGDGVLLHFTVGALG